MIELDGITKRFGGEPVLRGIDLRIEAGETLALLGPSGAGKSTVLRIVAGLEQPDGGRVRIGGSDAAGRPPHLRGVGYLFQELALFPHLDVRGNVEFGLRMAGRSRDERRRRVDELLELVGLPGTGHRDPSTLSGGERQRVALARALAPAPQVLLLDEPFGGLDRIRRDSLLDELGSIFEELALTVVAVTHDPAEAAALAGRVAALVDGRIVGVGDTASLFVAPPSRAVAAVLGLGNVCDGTLRDGVVEVSGWGRFPAGPRAPDRGQGSIGVLVAPHAISPADRPDRSVSCRIEAVRLRDGRPEVALRPVDGGPVLRADLGPAAARGDVVEVAIDPAYVHLMA